jgi:putative membrane protein
MASEPEAVVNMASASGIPGFVFLIAAGLIIAVGFVLPGISTSFMLLVLGLYEITLNAINTVNIPFLIPLVLGVAGGTIGTAKIIEKLLE